jgi:hypothetical protein
MQISKGLRDEAWIRLNHEVHMSKVMVYAFTQPDDSTGGDVAHRPYKATREVIERLPDAALIESSAEEVEEGQLDPSGYYHGRA